MKFQKGHPEEIFYPVRSLRKLQAEGTLIVSPRRGRKYGIDSPYTDENLPKYLEEVKEVRELVEKGEYPHDFMKKHYPWCLDKYPEYMPQPLYSEGLSYADPEACANIVKMDNPLDLPLAIQSWLITQGVKPRKRFSRFTDLGFKEFLKTVPSGMRYVARKQDMALERAFRVKYYHGTIRPEELHGENLTAYSDGSPCHPSFPAGHGAAGGAAGSSLIDYYDVNEEQIDVIRNCCYLWSMFRTFAGVHYAPDNIAGLEVGELLEKGYTNKRYAVK